MPKASSAWDASTIEAFTAPLACRCGTGILPVFHGRDAHATRGFARASVMGERGGAKGSWQWN